MQYIIVIDGSYWQLLEDGSLQAISSQEFLLLQKAGDVEVIQSSKLVKNNTASNSSGSNSAVSAQDPTINLASFFDNISRTGNEQLPDSGFLSGPLSDFLTDTEQNSIDEPSLPPPLSEDAQITVDILENGDDYLNRIEVPVSTIVGQTQELFDGQLIELVITDSEGQSLTFVTSVNNNAYTLSGRNLSSLAQGPAKVVATAKDFYGDSISATDETIIDTLAEIKVQQWPDDPNLDVDPSIPSQIWTAEDEAAATNDGRLNPDQITALVFSGEFDFVEPGRAIELLVSDQAGNVLKASSILGDDGRFSFSPLDLSTMVDGDITVTTTATDLAGNIAEKIDVFVKDSIATSTIIFDGTPPYGADELTEVSLSGVVSNIEAGQKVLVSVADTNGLEIDYGVVTVQPDGRWQTAVKDWSSLAEGDVTASIETIDRAGNLFSAQQTTFIDLQVSIDIDPDPISISDIRAGELTTITGSTDAEPGQSVIITLSSIIGGSQSFSGSVVSGGGGVYPNQFAVDVEVTELSGFYEWQMVASVIDEAGNIATDSTPTVINPTSVILSEGALVDFPAGYTVPSFILIRDYDAISFSADQSELEAVKVNGVALTVSGQGTNTLTASGGGNDILTAVIDATTNTVAVTLFNGVDQAGIFGPNGVSFGLNIDALQTSDLDGTTETLVAALPVVIRDSGPFTEDDQFNAIEAKPFSDNVFNNDNELEGPLTLVSVEYDGTVKVVTPLAPVMFTTDKGLLTVYSDGRVEFLSDRNLDNNNSQQIAFTYGALDNDGDYSSSSVTLDIEDGEGGFFPGDEVSVIEPMYPEDNNQALTFDISAGSDDLLAATVRFTGTQLSLLTSLDYTSSGSSVEYELTPDSKILTAYINGTNTVNNQVFTLELSASSKSDSSGDLIATATLTQFLPFDHVADFSLASQNIPFDVKAFPLAASAEDNDGTVSSASATLLINDGDNIALSSEAIAINEDVIDGVSDAQGTGAITVTIGSDQITTIGFIDGATQPVVTAGGETLLYSVDNTAPNQSILKAYLASNGDTDPHFVLTLNTAFNPETNNTLSYDFDWFKAVDQIDVNGVGVESIELDFLYQATDFDQDTSQDTIQITLNDSGPGAINGVSARLSESPRADISVPKQATLSFDVDAGKDKVNAAEFALVDGARVLDTSGNAVTQNGLVLNWAQQSEVLWTAQNTKGQDVFSAALPSAIDISPSGNGQIDLTVKVIQALDQIGSDEVSLVIPITVLDSDFTELSADAEITIIDGRDPKIGKIKTPSEDETLSVNEKGTLDKPNTNFIDSNKDGGLVNLIKGSDRIAEVNIVLETLNVTTNGGDAVTLAASVDSDGWYVASTAAAEAIFRVRIARTGELEFEQFGPLDHPDADGINELDLNFGVTAVDIEGDSSAQKTLTVEVIDDIPQQLNDREVALTEGSTRKFNVLNSEKKQGADTAVIESIIYDPDGNGDQTYSVPISGFSDPIILQASAISQGQYGTLRVAADGSVLITTTETPDETFQDKFSYNVLDKDGDVVTNKVLIQVQDEQSNITIEPTETDEDTDLILTLTADPGDLDSGESIRVISFADAPLIGSQLFIDQGAGLVELNRTTNGDYFLSIDEGTLVLTDASTGEVKPNGTLIFRPALNISDPTADVYFETTVVALTNTGLRETSVDFNVSIAPIVDNPVWQQSTLTYTQNEDAAPETLAIKADLFDTDGSERLSYSVANIDTDLILMLDGKTVADGQALTESQLSRLSYQVGKDFSGQLTFDVTAIAEETSTGDQAPITETVTINVAGVADAPILATSAALFDEDALIPLAELLSGSLKDTDDSETLYFEITLPDSGWSVVDSAQNTLGQTIAGTNVVRVSAADINNNTAFLKPKEDISSASPGGSIFDLPVRAVAVESAVDGVAPAVPETFSGERVIKLTIVGVNDLPEFDPGNDNLWTYTPGSVSGEGSLSAQGLEDTLIALNFGTNTEDDDGSEVFDFSIKNVPKDAELVDADGNFAILKISGEENGSPVYSLSAAELSNLFIKPAEDFSGMIDFDLVQTNTEPDGASTSYAQTVSIEVLPQVEGDVNLYDIVRGGEDEQTIFNIKPVYNDPDDPEIQYDDFGDLDESEALTNIIIESLPQGASFLVDGVEVAAVVNLDLNALAVANGYTFDELINGPLTLRPPEDSGQDFKLQVQFEITDTSPTGAVDVSYSDGHIRFNNWALVDDSAEDGITRIETASTPLVSVDGSPISLDGQAFFIEEDIDGSEYIDYISLSFPDGEEDGWYISHPNGAINDGQGNWLIKNNALTSDTAVDRVELLQGVTIVSDHVVGPILLEIKTRVYDQRDTGGDRDVDSDILFGSLSIEFQQPGQVGTVEAVSQLVKDAPIDGQEHNDEDREFGNTIPPVTISEHINQDASGDANDIVSFRIDAADRPQGGWFRGSGLVAEFEDDGSTVKAWVFPQSALADLALVGQDEDFSGDMTIRVHKIATDPLGKTIVTEENLVFDIIPQVDDIEEDAATIEMIEDIPARITVNLDNLLNDRSVSPAEDNEGIETIQSITFANLPDGAKFDYTGTMTGIFTDNGDGTFTLSDPTQLDDVRFVPPKNKHGEMYADMRLVIEDTTLGNNAYPNSVTDTKTTKLTFIVIADTDPAPVFTTTQEGDEDSFIAFNKVFALDVDDDGSEILSLQYRGVPEGATLFYDNGGTLELLVNDGPDGSGGFAWSFTKDQGDSIVFKPPKDFSGDINLTLRSSSMELTTKEIINVEDNFLVKVNPIADGADFDLDLEDLTLIEGDSINIVLDAEQLEQVNADETLVLVVKIAASSDESASRNSVGVRLADGSLVNFADNGAGLVALLEINSSTLESFDLVLADDAFGHLDVSVGVGSRDEAIVGGVLVVDNPQPSTIALQDFTIDITPKPDAPILQIAGFNIIAAVEEIPLGIDLTLVQPQATDGNDGAVTQGDEQNFVYITGVPKGLDLSSEGASLGDVENKGDVYIVKASAVSNLALVAGTRPPQPTEEINLTIQPVATLNGETDEGPRKTITITMADGLSGDNTLSGLSSNSNLIIGGDGNDTMTAAASVADTFWFRGEDLGQPSLSPPQDTIESFDVTQDRIDISDVIRDLGLSGDVTGADLDAVIDISEAGGSTLLEIDLGNGGLLDFKKQNIQIDGITKDDLNGGSTPTDEAALLQYMLDQQILIAG